jgi:two-component system sensor histidine kinase ChvG
VVQIRSELKRLNRLISDVSNASRLDAELALQQREPVDLAEVLRNVAGSFRDLTSGSGRAIKLDVIQRNPDDLLVLGQDGRLGQVATNLIDNAISFSPPDGTIRISLRRDADIVRLAIEDEGPGIDVDKLEKVFERFYTYRPTATTSRGNNSGLGLAITREIVKAHDGKIWAENCQPELSDNGVVDGQRRGARFVVTVPSAQRSGQQNRSQPARAWRV